MERRIRLLNKRSHGKGITERKADATNSSVESLRQKENSNRVNYIQIPLDSYTYLSSLEDQVDTLEGQISMLQDRVNDLTDDLYAADLEITAKDTSVKQHEKVAGEAVSGLEKANAEALALKHQLESVTVFKVTAEDRASHLDAALKECMRQITTVKEENDQKLQELILNKTEQWEKIKVGLEAQIADLSQRLLQSDAESAAFSRSLQKQSSMLIGINEQKSQAEVDSELLKGNMQSYENQINSLKYNLHVVTKELEIRKEEKNKGKRSAEAANKQHLEDVKKWQNLKQSAKGYAILCAKVSWPCYTGTNEKEIGNMGHDSVEPQPRKPPLPGKNFKSLLLMEKEITMLKETLVTKNSELQSSRDICAKMVGRFKNLEAQIGILNQKISSWRSSFEIPAEGCVIHNTSSSCNAASMSEDGSSVNLQATVPFSDHTMHKSTSKWSKPVNANSLEIMDDFLEMERLACSTNKGDKVFSTSRTETSYGNATVETKKGKNLSQSTLQSNMNPPANKESTDVEKSAKGLDSDMVQQLLLNLLSKIPVILESQTKDTDMRKAMDDTVHAMQEIGNSLPCHSSSFSAKESHPDDEFSDNIEASSQNITKMTKRDFLSIQVNKPDTDEESITDQDLVAAVSRIHQFVLSVDRKVMQAHEKGSDIEPKDLTASVDSFLLNKIILVDFFLDLSHVLVQASELKFREMIKFQLHEKEQLLVDLQSQLEASQKDLEVKTENLDNMLQEEKCNHQDSLIRYMNLKEKLQRNKNCSMCSSSHSSDRSNKSKEREIAATAAKLAVLWGCSSDEEKQKV